MSTAADEVQRRTLAATIRGIPALIRGLIPATYAAGSIVYDNATSGLAATTAQDAIDEVARKPVAWLWLME